MVGTAGTPGAFIDNGSKDSWALLKKYKNRSDHVPEFCNAYKYVDPKIAQFVDIIPNLLKQILIFKILTLLYVMKGYHILI